MAQVRTNPTTGANGDALTTANSGSSFTPVVTGGTSSISTAQYIIGTRSWLFTATTTSGGDYLIKNGLSATSVNMDMYMYITGAPSAAVVIMWAGTGSRQASIELNTNRTITIKNAAASGGTGIWTSTYAIPLNTWVRVAFYLVQSATVGQARAAIYLGHNTTPETGGDSTLLTNQNTGASAYTDLRWGSKASTGTQTLTLYMGSYAYDPAATGLGAPYGLPICNVGADQSGLEPGKIATIDGSASDPVVGSITNWAYSISPSGPTLVGSGATRTMVVPPTLTGQTWTVTLVITNTGGNTSTDTMTINANPASRRVKIGGVMVPVFSRPMGG